MSCTRCLAFTGAPCPRAMSHMPHNAPAGSSDEPTLRSSPLPPEPGSDYHLPHVSASCRFLRKQQRAAATAAAAISGEGTAGLAPTAAAASVAAAIAESGAAATGWPVMGRRRGVGVRPLARFRLEELEEDGGREARRMGPAVGAVLRHRLGGQGAKKGGKEGKGKEGKGTVKGEGELEVEE